MCAAIGLASPPAGCDRGRFYVCVFSFASTIVGALLHSARLYKTTVAASLPRALLAKGRYPFRHASTARLLRQASLLATIASTHRIAFSGAAPLYLGWKHEWQPSIGKNSIVSN